MNVFAPMLMGSLAVPITPKANVTKVSADRHVHKTWGDGLNSAAMAVYLDGNARRKAESRERVIAAIASGSTSREAIAKAAKMSLSNVLICLKDLKADGAVICDDSGRPHKWRLK
jgi:predicted Rossmann fold nucleotide-binding protein DprA/Smf involved in DNA uptake